MTIDASLEEQIAGLLARGCLALAGSFAVGDRGLAIAGCGLIARVCRPLKTIHRAGPIAYRPPRDHGRKRRSWPSGGTRVAVGSRVAAGVTVGPAVAVAGPTTVKDTGSIRPVPRGRHVAVSSHVQAPKCPGPGGPGTA